MSRSIAVALVLVTVACGRSEILPIEGTALDALSYGRSWRIYLAGHTGDAWVPTKRGWPVEFSIAPPLPAGLHLDSHSGAIDGTPSTVAPEATHTITAANAHGEISTTLTIAVLDGWMVDDAVDGEDVTPGDDVCATAAGGCSLQAALEESGAGSEGRIIVLPAGTWDLGVPRTTWQSVALVGAGESETFIDLQGGGGIELKGESAELADVTVKNAESGAVAIHEAALRVSHVTFANNRNDISSGGYGALGITGGTSDIEYITVRDSESWTGSGVAMHGAGTHSVRSSSFVNNRSHKFDNATGALSVGWQSHLEVFDSYFANNRANGGGAAIFTEYGATLRVVSSTFYANGSAGSAGAVFVGMHRPGDASFASCTFVANQGSVAALLVASGSTMTLVNNLFAGNTSDNGDCRGAVISLGGNVGTVEDCSSGPLDVVVTGAVIDGIPADHGGPVPTIALPASSAAVDAGVDEECPATDARSLPRPVDGGDGAGGPPDGIAACDAGAFELQ